MRSTVETAAGPATSRAIRPHALEGSADDPAEVIDETATGPLVSGPGGELEVPAGGPQACRDLQKRIGGDRGRKQMVSGGESAAGPARASRTSTFSGLRNPTVNRSSRFTKSTCDALRPPRPSAEKSSAKGICAGSSPKPPRDTHRTSISKCWRDTARSGPACMAASGCLRRAARKKGWRSSTRLSPSRRTKEPKAGFRAS